MGFFGRNLVAQYPYERSVVDGVNVGFEIFRIRTEIGERGATVKAGYDLPVRDKRTRAERYETLTEDFIYTPTRFDRTVLAPNQIRTVLEAYRDSLFTELFPGRHGSPEDARLRQRRPSCRGDRRPRPRGVRQGQRLRQEDHLSRPTAAIPKR